MRPDKHAGFTLVEMMISVSLVVLVIGISTSSWLALGRASSIVKQCSDMHAELRQAFDKMTKDIISARSIDAASTGWFKITANRAGVSQAVLFQLTGGKLYQIDATSRVIAENVTSFSYRMYKEDGVTETATPSEAFSIDIVVTAETRVNTQTFDDTFQSRIMLRNKYDP